MNELVLWILGVDWVGWVRLDQAWIICLRSCRQGRFGTTTVIGSRGIIVIDTEIHPVTIGNEGLLLLVPHA